MELTERDVRVVRNAQEFLRREKAKHVESYEYVVNCPFKFINFNLVSYDPCTICHNWMGTSIKVWAHPCSVLPKEEVIKLFWRPCKEVY
jgi:hypothetical protein